MNTSGPQTTAAHPSSVESNCLPLPCAFGAAEASDSIGGGEQKKNSNTYVSTESGEVQPFPRSGLMPLWTSPTGRSSSRRPARTSVPRSMWSEEKRPSPVSTRVGSSRWRWGSRGSARHC